MGHALANQAVSRGEQIDPDLSFPAFSLSPVFIPPGCRVALRHSSCKSWLAVQGGGIGAVALAVLYTFQERLVSVSQDTKIFACP